ncbi:MAG TPA: zinc-binding dehydrogenase [Ktedonobacterales bacterium]|jgi:threonine dehydrogenase-like Zn-dependent dehydrogenase|nr:zinc-binding dehydrogenase [Ktedonobacterales bacterium]
MWSVYLDNNPLRAGSARALGVASRRAYHSPLAPLRARKVSKTALPGRRWVRIRNFMAGISGTDLALVHLQTDPSVGLMALPRPSRTYLGREVVGEVIDIGPEAEFLRVGDRVAYQLDQCCATRDIEPPCRHCASGNYSICENRYLPGPQPIGGGWGDEMILHERQLFLVPDGLADEQAALLEPSAVALHAALRHQPQPEENVLVIGAGSIGLLTIQAVRVFAPQANVTVLARHPFQVEMATRMGATRMLYVEDGTAAVARMTGGRHYRRRLGPELLVGGFDVIYDTVGSDTTMQQALQWVRGRGTIVQAGMRLERMHLDPTPIWDQEVNICGAIGHGSESWPGGAGLASAWSADNGGRVSTFALAAALIRERRLTPQRLVTHRFPLREVRRAVEVARDKATHRSIKVLLDIRDVAMPSEAVEELQPVEASE